METTVIMKASEDFDRQYSRTDINLSIINHPLHHCTDPAFESVLIIGRSISFRTTSAAQRLEPVGPHPGGKCDQAEIDSCRCRQIRLQGHIRANMLQAVYGWQVRDKCLTACTLLHFCKLESAPAQLGNLMKTGSCLLVVLNERHSHRSPVASQNK